MRMGVPDQSKWKVNDMVKQVSVFVENRPGKLAGITKVLKDNQIHIRALSVADTMDFGILRMIVSDPEKAYQVLKESGCTASLTKVLAVGFPDEPGSMGKVVRMLSDAGISIEYVYAFGLKGDVRAYGVFKLSDPELAKQVLQSEEIILLGPDQLYHHI